jgi:hypothetical protein
LRADEAYAFEPDERFCDQRSTQVEFASDGADVSSLVVLRELEQHPQHAKR